MSDNIDKSMIHLNGNVLCAVDVETTGLVCGTHDIWEVAILPLDHDFKPNKKHKYFSMQIKPKRPENADPKALRISKVTLADILVEGQDPWKAADMLEEWFDRLNLGVGRQLVPLAHNWPFDKAFLLEWLGPATFNYIFHYHYRDSMVAASFINDRAYDQAEQIPWGRIGMGSMCNYFNVENKTAHRALSDCVATAEVYGKMVRMLKV